MVTMDVYISSRCESWLVIILILMKNMKGSRELEQFQIKMYTAIGGEDELTESQLVKQKLAPTSQNKTSAIVFIGMD